MPYKFDTDLLLIPVGLRRNTKLSDADVLLIREMYINGTSINRIAKAFGVHKRTIQFRLFPERLERNRELRDLRGGSMQYYDKAIRSEVVKKHRRYKQSLASANLLIEGDKEGL